MAYKDKSKKEAYQNEYIRQTYDVIRATPNKAEGQQIRQAAAAAGQSVSAYILDAVRQRMERDK